MNNEFDGMSQTDLRQAIQDHVAGTPEPEPLDKAKQREEDLRAGFFLRADHSQIDPETRAAAVKQITDVLRELGQ